MLKNCHVCFYQGVFGQFDLTLFDDSNEYADAAKTEWWGGFFGGETVGTPSPTFGKALMMIFLTIMNIVMMNLLIAVMSSNYEAKKEVRRRIVPAVL
jgi:hypothetical protein